MSTEYAVKTEGLSKRFGNFEAVHELSIHIPAGTVYGFLGRNGAGKTTTMKMLMGLIRPTKGSFLVFGRPFDRKATLPLMGSLIERPSYYGHLTGRENLSLVCDMRGAEQSSVDEVLRIVGLQEASDKLARSYSLGMKQRLGLAMAIIGWPRLLILDEPTNGLDPAGIHEMRELICGLPSVFDTTVLISSHILSEVEQMATTVGIINQGALAFEGSLSVLRDEGKLLLKSRYPQRTRAILRNTLHCNLQENDSGELVLPPLPDESVYQMVHELVCENGIDICRLEFRQETLEDAFLRLTTSEIR